ncbi:hypothetical protein ENUP19_0079G0035 [Entamoeba nuttalli]|uniref:Uncharacterized protein n=2 Tax=Entamoeba nuttalli TaxID=412467 RepID=K2H8H5_ENTNP|nr:hypothetical protein ENU1_004860 [Entamoeba nuttalli P19]EKE42917.1 hypothetical protein ENU1_004860 [Entamoeba nuttalli P19]|eukprot:XP_008854745.1 hypothetical protein ENU1_004860 [Entamoeba nuttalli P19]
MNKEQQEQLEVLEKKIRIAKEENEELKRLIEYEKEKQKTFEERIKENKIKHSKNPPKMEEINQE